MNASNFGFTVHYTEEQHDGTEMVQKKGFIACTCDGRTKKRELPKDGFDKVFESIRNYNFCGQSDTSPVCDLIKKCQNCTAEIQKCSLVSQAKSLFQCHKKQYTMRERHLISTDNGEVKVKERVARQVRTCSYPTNLRTADVSCKKYPSSMECTEKCIFGYTLKEGISREMHCKYSENVWTPTGFEECRPFVDCTMALVSAGRLDCMTGTTKFPPSCNVTCDHYEDKPATPQRTYECKISGAWSIKLPFCVTSGSGLDLVPAPSVKLHLF